LGFVPVHFGSSQNPAGYEDGANALEFTPSPAAVAPSELPTLSNRVSLRDDLDLTECFDDLEIDRPESRYNSAEAAPDSVGNPIPYGP
jgi:hypothetical protein